MTSVPAALAGRIDVSRETMQRLETYVALVEKWQPRINLVSPNSLPDIWMRHVWDSAQLAPLIPAGTARLLDVGSGGGFPGLVLAMCCNAECHLVESDQRKAVFLSTVIRECGLTAKVHNSRIEALPDLDASVITARALAPLDRLLGASWPTTDARNALSVPERRPRQSRDRGCGRDGESAPPASSEPYQPGWFCDRPDGDLTT